MANSPKDLAAQTKDAQLHTKKNDTKNNAKAVSMECLEARLADSIDLGLVTKQAHWNLKGPQFIGVHLMLDKFRGEQDEWTDSIAERIVQLGGTAKGTVQEIMSRTALKPYPTDAYKIADHLAALIERYASCANAIPAEHRRYGRRRRCRHGRLVHRGVARPRQAALVPRGPCSGAERHLPRIVESLAPSRPGP